MSVSVTVELPDQPTDGLVSVIDLGGDGFSSPRSVLQFRVVSDGDGSSGFNTISVQMDPVYTAVVSYLAVSGSALSQAGRFTLGPGPEATDNVNALVTADDLSLGLTMTAGWMPPPMVLQAKDNPLQATLPRVQFVCVNTDSEDWTFKGQIYLFDKNAVFAQPVENLLQPLLRGSQTF